MATLLFLKETEVVLNQFRVQIWELLVLKVFSVYLVDLVSQTEIFARILLNRMVGVKMAKQLIQRENIQKVVFSLSKGRQFLLKVTKSAF